ncbi:hypothetical protein skT53_26910 [Effusibacillus dendaii]|uniref:AbrB family transcriptional regulator n=2 Tax=Effusibacillus dendaii TaxID=2743772 RepID=A0A7I8DFQ8_9BACL|nr:hypothetical protein skT53_26910 [Effusibacillus dendaii]
MPAIAEEVGANTVVVTIVQVTRILVVVGLIPIFVRVEDHNNHMITTSVGVDTLTNVSMWWAGCLLLAAQIGYLIMKRLRFPAARMIGGIIGVALCQLISTSITDTDLVPWYPAELKVIIQIILGASLGLSIKKEMFKGLGKITLLGIFSSSALLVLMVFFSYLLSSNSGISYLTAILAFAPGGVAEMTVTALSLQENVPFVASAQTLRIIMTFLLIPPLCRFLSVYLNFKRDTNHNM